MSKRLFLAVAPFWVLMLSTPVMSQQKAPEALSGLKPHEVVEAITAEAKQVNLTTDQLARLDSLHLAVRDERHRWTRAPGNKAHRDSRMQPMISRNQAYSDALNLLTPSQRASVMKQFDEEDYVPVVPSLLSVVPPSLEDLNPHEIVQVFTAEAEALGLTEAQQEDLQRLHVAVRDEPHSYKTVGAPGKAHRRRMMEPMVSKRRAYNDALSYLTPGQQERAMKRFSGRGYKPPASEES